MINEKKAANYLIFACALKQMMFTLPVVMLFFQHKGVSIGDFFLIQGLFAFAAFFLEIPTGYIGDLFSRKITLVVGFIIHIIGHLFFIYGFGFNWLLAGELCFAISLALYSGTAEAYLYDLLKKENKQRKFHKKIASLSVYTSFASLLAVLSGGAIYQFISPEATVWFSVLTNVITVVVIAMLPDVPEARRRVAKEKSKLQDIADISKFAIKHPQIKWLILFPSIFGALTLILFWGLQPAMIARQIPVFMFSIIIGANFVVRMFYGIIGPKLLEKKQFSGVIKHLFAIIVISLIGAILSQYLPSGAVYFCLGLMLFGSAAIILVNIVTSTLINHRIASQERATVLSVRSMAGRVFNGIAMVSLKPLLDGIGVGQTLIISAILLIPIFYIGQKLIKMNLSTQEEEL